MPGIHLVSGMCTVCAKSMADWDGGRQTYYELDSPPVQASNRWHSVIGCRNTKETKIYICQQTEALQKVGLLKGELPKGKLYRLIQTMVQHTIFCFGR